MKTFTIPTLLLGVTVSFFCGLVAALAVSRFGIKWGLADLPTTRSSHRKPTPRAGGIGIPLAAAAVSFGLLHRFDLLVVLALALAFITFITDLRELPVALRFSLQFFFSLALVWVYKKELLLGIGLYWGVLPMLLLGLFLVLYMVAAANIFNFMDGINGIAGLEAVLGFGFLGIFMLVEKNSAGFAPLAFSTAAASAGFLILNFPRARVFMGDVGSIFLGFLFAVLVVHLAAGIEEFLLLTSFQGIFYVDGLSTIFLRLLRRENLLKAHRKHLYQELVHRSRWPHHRVALAYAAAQGIVCVTAMGIFKYRADLLPVLWGGLFLAYWFIRVRKKFLD